jgi:membrane-associated phospholipid phosphatase
VKNTFGIQARDGHGSDIRKQVAQINQTKLPSRTNKLNKFVRARLSPESFVGLQLTAGLVAFTIAAIIFVLLAEDVATADTLTLLDAQINVWLHAHNTPHLTTFFLLVSKLHSNLIVTTVMLAICVYLWSKHLRYWVLTFLLAVPGGMLLNVLLKLVFARPRPRFDDPILRLKTFSFPSGHTMLAVVFYGTLCVFAIARLRGWKMRAPAILLAAFMIALVGFSRMYLGAHYLSDVLGAMAEGFAWLAFCFLVVGLIREWARR